MSSHRDPVRRILVAAALALANTVGAPALFAQEEAAPVFGESIDVRVVNVEVVVTDRSGERVSGLTPDAFELLVDGEPVEIDYFSEYLASIAASDAVSEPAEPASPRATTRPGTRSVPTNVLIFVDDVFAIHAKKRLVIKNLIRQLSELGPGDRVAVVSWTGRRLEVRTSWTSSPEDIERILEEAAKFPSRGIYYRPSPYDDLAETMTAAASALRLAGVPEGRRIMLLLAGSWPSVSIVDDPFGPATASAEPPARESSGFAAFQRLWRSRYASPLQPLVDTANSLGYTVYPVTTAGLPPSGPGVAADRPSAGMGPISQIWDGTIMFLAHETGGRMMWAGNRFKALGRALDDGRSYYLLGFTSRSEKADRYRIKVRMKDDAYRVRYRRSFVDFDSRMSAHSLLEAGLLSGGAFTGSSDGLELRVAEMRAQPRRRRYTDVEFEVAVPVGRLTFLPDREGVERARVELSFGVIDRKGALSDITVVPLGLEKPRSAAAGSRVIYRQRITIRSRPHDLMTVLRDVATDEILQGRIELDPPRRRGRPAPAATPTPTATR